MYSAAHGGKGGRRRPPALALSLLMAGLVLLAAPATSAVEPVVVKPTQELAILRMSHQAFSRPDAHSAPVEVVQVRRPITDEQTVLPVLAHARATDGLDWLQVRLPGRPNGHKGWIHSRGTAYTGTSWHVVVSASARRVVVYRSGRVVRVFRAVVGKPSTPTPLGEFFVEEVVQLPADEPGAPFALALSARSTVLQEFDGGPGQIALHGVANIGGALGTAVSHGCVRLATSSIVWLAWHIRTGVPVTVTR